MIVFKRLLAATLCTLIAFPPQSFAAMSSGPGGEIPENVDPKVEAYIQDIESGRIKDHPAHEADMFHLTNQVIEVFDKKGVHTFNMNERQAEIPYVAFTNLKIIYDKPNQRLFFDAYRGVDANGENGVLVARQTLNNIDLMTSAQDAELFQFVDSNLKLHVIDMGMVATQIFKSPIPVFQNLWQPDAEMIKAWTGDDRNSAWKGVKLRSGFLTRGSVPLNLSRAVLVPKDEKTGGVSLTAGDFYIASEAANGAESFAYAVFKRDITYLQITQSYKILQWQSALLSSKPEIQAQVEKIADSLVNELDKEELALMNEKVSPAARAIIGAFNKDTIASAKKREGDVKDLRGNVLDTFTPGEWSKTYAEIAKNVEPLSSDKQTEEQWFKFINKVQADAKENQKKESVLSIRENLKKLRTNLATDNVYKAIAIAISVSIPPLYTATFPLWGPQVAEQFETLQQLKVVAWTYENYFPGVLKDASYRWTLAWSMASLVMIWPEALMFSWIAGKTFKSMAEKMKTETSRKAVYIKDLAHNWSGLSTWQRITSFGMRGYAWLILPYWRVLIQYAAQNKTFFSAINNDLNPLQKVLARSDIGQKLGLTENQRIGLNKIAGQGKDERIVRNLKIQGAVAEENHKLDSIAMLVAATLVAEKHNIDPALLLMLGQEAGDLQVNKVAAILDSPEKRAEWQMLTQRLIGQLSEIKSYGIVVDKHMNDLIEVYFATGEKIAAQLDSMSSLRKRFLRFRMAFSSQMSDKKKRLANFATGDHEFLKRVYTNEFVSEQVKKEFTIDHVMVVGIVGLIGERADMSHPEHLSADPAGFLWTAKAHWYDIFSNTFAHFFQAGAGMALIFQKIKPRIAENYAPIEDYQFQTRQRGEGLASGIKNWTQVFNLEKSDLGGIVTKRFAKRFTTVTAGITMMLLLRVGLWDQSLHTALLAWSFMFITGQWFYGWIWDPVQRGNDMEGERIAEMDQELKVARRKINRGNFEEGRTELIGLYSKFNPKVLSAFKLEDMSKYDLLQLSVQEPPIYTKANRWTSWFTTWTAAVGSTVMAVPLSVILMDDRLINAKETWMAWVPLSAGLYTAAYFLQSRYITRMKEAYTSLKAKWDAKITDPLMLKLIADSNARIEKDEARKQEKADAAQAKSELAIAKAELELAKKQVAEAQPKLSISEQFAQAKARLFGTAEKKSPAEVAQAPAKVATTDAPATGGISGLAKKILGGKTCQDVFAPTAKPSLRPTFR